MILCANKVDLSQDLWKVKREEYESFSRDMNIPLFECSASSGYNVQELFSQLAADILKNNKANLTEVEEVDQQGRNGHSLILADFADREKRRKQQKSSCCG
jgi:GTPase SAR1 family protein